MEEILTKLNLENCDKSFLMNLMRSLGYLCTQGWDKYKYRCERVIMVFYSIFCLPVPSCPDLVGYKRYKLSWSIMYASDLEHQTMNTFAWRTKVWLSNWTAYQTLFCILPSQESVLCVTFPFHFSRFKSLSRLKKEANWNSVRLLKNATYLHCVLSIFRSSRASDFKSFLKRLEDLNNL